MFTFLISGVRIQFIAGGGHSNSHDDHVGHAHHDHIGHEHSHSHSLEDLSVGISVLGKYYHTFCLLSYWVLVGFV